MILFRSIAKTSLRALFFLISIGFSAAVSAQDGKALFSANCASCHQVHKKLTGPALAGVEDRWPDKKKLHAWIHNSAAFLKTGDAYANNLYNEYNKTAMNAFPNFTDKEIDAILAYIKSVPAPGAGGAAAGAGAVDPNDAKNADSDSSLLFGILTLILAVVTFVMLQVNANLKKLADERAGLAALEPVPFWRNKSYITMATVVLFLIGGYLTSKGAIGLGRSKDYQPEQPIYYSHAVHAGTNQINCQYCHTGVYQGKQATIPSVNVCMNCHMAINEYKGAKIYNEAGEEVNGTAEIKKLYKYAGFEEGKPWD
ncbi:MAG: c-type cytochrome, partial [Sediminibacterium sp.]